MTRARCGEWDTSHIISIQGDWFSVFSTGGVSIFVYIYTFSIYKSLLADSTTTNRIPPGSVNNLKSFLITFFFLTDGQYNYR